MEQKYAASAIIYNDQGLVLLARRSPTKYPFPNILSLPSTYIRGSDKNLVRELVSDEKSQEQLRAAVMNKLGIDLKFKGLIGRKSGKQADYYLTMSDYFAQIIGGALIPNQEDFTEANFYDPLELFKGKDRTKMGFCTQILLGTLERDPKFWREYLFI